MDGQPKLRNKVMVEDVEIAEIRNPCMMDIYEWSGYGKIALESVGFPFDKVLPTLVISWMFDLPITYDSFRTLDGEIQDAIMMKVLEVANSSKGDDGIEKNLDQPSS